MRDTKLKPCPFCGGKADFWEWKRARTINTGCMTNSCIAKKLRSKYLVRCTNKKYCNGNTPSTKLYWTKKEAIEEWNRRAV